MHLKTGQEEFGQKLSVMNKKNLKLEIVVSHNLLLLLEPLRKMCNIITH